MIRAVRVLLALSVVHGTSPLMAQTSPATAAPVVPPATAAPVVPPATAAPVIPAAPASQADPSAPSAAPAVAPVAPEWRQAMTLYELGQGDQALDQIRSLVLRCGDSSAPECSQAELATLYACGAIILAGAKNQHAASVQAFRKALALDASIALLPEYQIAPVIAAYYEARGILPPGPKTSPAGVLPESPEPQPTDKWPAHREHPPLPPSPQEAKHRAFLLLGAGAACCASVEDYSFQSYESRVAPGVGASALIGLNPGAVSGFAMAIQARAYGFLSERSWFDAEAAMLLGSTVGRRREDTFTFFFGGVGAGVSTESGRGYPALHFLGGTSLKGLMLSGSMVFGGWDNVTYVLFGGEVGWGKLL